MSACDVTYDVCIVGAGPGGLAALSAVLEPYSVDQLSNSGAWRAGKAIRTLKGEDGVRKVPRVCVIDPEPWLASWRRRFQTLGIDWLRSPTLAHPDAFDAGSLHAFAVSQGRESELKDPSLANDVKQVIRISKSPKGIASRPDWGAGLWRLPSNALFLDFCDDLVGRLPHDFRQAKAVTISGEDGNFQVALSTGDEVLASNVVLALGFPGPAVVPAVFSGLPSEVIHNVPDSVSDTQPVPLRKGERVLVCGGGLTAVQAAQKAHRKGCQVSLLSRRPLTTRVFDVDASWFDARGNNALHYEFLGCSSEERLRMIKSTRGGGSVPPMYMTDIQSREAQGGLKILCGEADVAVANASGGVDLEIGDKSVHVDRVLLACGHRGACSTLPLVADIMSKWPAPTEGGLPVISQDLQWPGLERLFVVGALAALQVGPDAGNLMGLRRASQVIVSAMDLRAWLRESNKTLVTNIRGNRFLAFQDSDNDSDSEDDTSTKDTFEQASSTSSEEVFQKVEVRQKKPSAHALKKRARAIRNKKSR